MLIVNFSSQSLQQLSIQPNTQMFINNKTVLKKDFQNGPCNI